MAGEWNQSLSNLGDFIAQLIMRNKQMSAQGEALKNIGQYFQTEQANYSPSQMGKPSVDQYGVPRLAQPISPQSVSFQTVPTTPSPTSFDFLSALANYSQMGGNPEPFYQASQYNIPKVTPINQEAGGLDVFSAYPSGKFQVTRAIPPDFSRYGMGQPTELAKYQNELSMIRKANPNDPRIPQYEDMIKKLTQGLPVFNFQATSEGIVPGNVRTGQVGGPVAQKPLTGEMITAEQQIGALKESLDKVKSLYKPEYVGAVAGRMGELKQATVGVPEDQAGFYSAIADIGNTLIYLKSGKQINEQEYNRLQKQIPAPTDPVSTFNGKMKEFERELNSVISNRRAAQGGYGIPGKPAQKKSKYTILKVE